MSYVDTPPLRVLALFAGVGGLGLGVRIAVPDSRTVCHVEIGIEACEVLAARMADGSLDQSPIFTDISTFDGRPWRGSVDLVEGGSPCQDLSVAGKRAGIGGKRSGLWGEYRRVIEEVQPTFVFFENVAGIISSLTLLHNGEIMGHLEGLLLAAAVAPTPRDRWYIERHHERLHRRLLKTYGIPALLYVQCGLEEMGYRCETGFFTASEVGASHKRERVFILAHRAGRRLGILREPSGSNRLADGSHAELADNPQPRSRGISEPAGRIDPTDIDRRIDELGHAACDDEQRDTVAGMYREGIAAGGSGGSMADAAQQRRQGIGSLEPGDIDTSKREPSGCTGSREVADSPQNEWNRSHREAGPGRGVCETGDKLADAANDGRECGPGSDPVGRDLLPALEGVQCGREDRPGEPERCVGIVADAGDGLIPQPGRGSQGRDGTGPAGEVLADYAHDLRRRGISGKKAGVREDELRRRGFAGGERTMGNSDIPRLEGRIEPGCGLSDERVAGAAGDTELADAGCERDERRGISGELESPRREIEGESQQRERCRDAIGNSLPLFAPGPSDPRLACNHPRIPLARPSHQRRGN